MPKVTVIVETDDQHTKVSREGNDPGMLLAQCIHRVADTYNDSRLDEIAKAVEEAVQRLYARRAR